MKLDKFTKTLIICSKCGMTAKKLFYLTRINGYKQHQGTGIGFCENCKRYEIPKKIEKPNNFFNLVDTVILQK